MKYETEKKLKKKTKQTLINLLNLDYSFKIITCEILDLSLINKLNSKLI